jgi:hypothetical protein
VAAFLTFALALTALVTDANDSRLIEQPVEQRAESSVIRPFARSELESTRYVADAIPIRLPDSRSRARAMSSGTPRSSLRFRTRVMCARPIERTVHSGQVGRGLAHPSFEWYSHLIESSGRRVSDMREDDFVAQSEEFFAAAISQFPDDAAATVDDVLIRAPQPLTPVVINDLASVSEVERDQLRSSYLGSHGVAHFTVPAGSLADGRHFLLELAEQMAGELPLSFPVDHPVEQNQEARRRFGPSDGTLKLYDLEIPKDADRYREQAKTKEMFAAHTDGLGFGGAVVASILGLDSPPAWGGYTCFQQFVRLSLALRNDDKDAFESLFLPDAIVALRPRSEGAIRVTSPVLYVNDRGEPQVFFWISSGEYRISWRADVPPLARARDLLLRLAQPFAPSSSFVHLMHPGEGVIIRNTQAVHSRTPFEDDVYGTSRVLARKWFVATAADAKYKHVPGMNVHPRYGSLFPELFAPEFLRGEWHWSADSASNLPVVNTDP